MKKFSERPVSGGSARESKPERAGEEFGGSFTDINDYDSGPPALLRSFGRVNLYYFGAHYYAPCLPVRSPGGAQAGLCRFTSVDPLWNKAPSECPYCYAGNNPLRFNDPTGLTKNDTGGTADPPASDNLTAKNEANKLGIEGQVLDEVVISAEKITGAKTVSQDATRVEKSPTAPLEQSQKPKMADLGNDLDKALGLSSSFFGKIGQLADNLIGGGGTVTYTKGEMSDDSHLPSPNGPSTPLDMSVLEDLGPALNKDLKKGISPQDEVEMQDPSNLRGAVENENLDLQIDTITRYRSIGDKADTMPETKFSTVVTKDSKTGKILSIDTISKPSHWKYLIPKK